MGKDAKYVMVSRQELEQLLSDETQSQRIIDNIRDDRSRIRPRFEPPDDSFEKEVAANPFVLHDVEKLTSYINKCFADLREQQALSQQRLWGGDREEYIDEICRLYALGQRRWERCDSLYQEGNHFQAFKQFGGLTEDELALEAIRRGYHLWLDLGNIWDTMHEFLTGMSIEELRAENVLSNAMPFFEQAKLNPSYPAGCVTAIEEARNTVRSMVKKVVPFCTRLELRVNKLYCETDDCPDELSDMLKMSQEIRQIIGEAEPALYAGMMNIAVVQTEDDKAESEANADDFAGAGRHAETIASLSASILLKLNEGTLSERELNLTKELNEKARSIKIQTTTRVRPKTWHQMFPDSLAEKTVSDIDLFSIAIYGSKDVSGLQHHYASYISVEETKAIADLLQPLTSDDLAEKHGMIELADWEQFYQVKKFYIRAAMWENGILVFID